MKIKTITCHNVYNYGASLQEYALLKFLNKNGYEAEAINYRPSYLNNHHNLLRISNTRYTSNYLLRILYLIAKLPERLISLKRKIEFDKFSKKYIPETKIIFRSNKDLKLTNWDTNTFIAGSDQIWNTLYPNGKDPAFYLDFAGEHSNKISYAASIATNTIEEKYTQFVFNSILKLNHVSVRELSAKNILRNLGISNVSVVLDPVFLLEKNEWLAISPELNLKNFVLIYDCEQNLQIKRLALHLKSKYNLQIVTISNKINYADKSYSLKGPTTFIQLINNANFILTNSFHAVAFSVIFNKSFFVFGRNENINTRMKDLVTNLGIEELYIDKSEQLTELENKLPHIDYNRINLEIAHLKSESQEFLLNAILSKPEVVDQKTKNHVHQNIL